MGQQMGAVDPTTQWAVSRCLGAYTNRAGGFAPWILLLNAAVDRAGMGRQIGALEPTTHRTGGYAPWILLLNAAVDRAGMDRHIGALEPTTPSGWWLCTLDPSTECGGG
jgi:hypothetical protein